MRLCLHLLIWWVAAGTPAVGEISSLAVKENVFPAMAARSLCREVSGRLAVPSGLLAVPTKRVV